MYLFLIVKEATDIRIQKEKRALVSSYTVSIRQYFRTELVKDKIK